MYPVLVSNLPVFVHNCLLQFSPLQHCWHALGLSSNKFRFVLGLQPWNIEYKNCHDYKNQPMKTNCNQREDCLWLSLQYIKFCQKCIVILFPQTHLMIPLTNRKLTDVQIDWYILMLDAVSNPAYSCLSWIVCLKMS